MKKVKFFTELNVATNIAILVCYVLTAILMYNETAENGGLIVQASFYLGLLGSIAVIAMAALGFSIAAVRNLDKEYPPNIGLMLYICCIFNCLAIALTATAFFTMLTSASDNILKVDPYATIIIGGIWASVFGTAFAIVAAILLKKHAKH